MGQSRSGKRRRECIKKLLKKITQEKSNFWTRLVDDCKGVSEETTTGVLRLNQMVEIGALLFPVINVNDSVTKVQVWTTCTAVEC